jgi:hypothetical protein
VRFLCNPKCGFNEIGYISGTGLTKKVEILSTFYPQANIPFLDPEAPYVRSEARSNPALLEYFSFPHIHRLYY